MAGNFLQIGLARMGVGVGEAGGSPPSHSIISDLYPKEERAGALGVYSMGIPLGIMAAYFATASLMGAAGEAVDWRRIFYISGTYWYCVGRRSQINFARNQNEEQWSLMITPRLCSHLFPNL